MASSSSPRAQKRKRYSSDDVDPSHIVEKRTRGTPPLLLSPPSLGSAPDVDGLVMQAMKAGISAGAMLRVFQRMTRESRQTPSDLTSHSPHQVGDDPMYLCYRPQHAVPPVPVILLFEPLSHFLVNLKTIAITDDDLSVAQKFLVDLHSEQYVRDHQKKVFQMVLDIHAYCANCAHVIPSLSLKDGTTLDGAGFPTQSTGVCLWLEYKAEIGKSGDPFFQVLNYALRSAAQYTEHDFQTYGVAICVSGPQLQVLAVTVVGEKIWAEPLGIVQCYGCFEALEATARVWASVRQFFLEYKPVRKFTSEPVPWCLREYPDLHRLDARRLLYTYTNEQGQKEIAKFARSYCKEAHTAWMPYAPERRGIDLIAGKWWLVRMEYLSQDEDWRPAAEIVKDAQTDPDPNHIAKIKSCVVQMVEKGHAQGFVHGDMRLPNILLRKGYANEADGFPRYEVRLLDFDWSGESGLAKYPRRLNKEVDWPPGATYGALISKEHDIWFANYLMQQL